MNKNLLTFILILSILAIPLFGWFIWKSFFSAGADDFKEQLARDAANNPLLSTKSSNSSLLANQQQAPAAFPNVSAPKVSASQQTAPPVVTNTAPSETKVETPKEVSYKSETLGLSFDHPENMLVAENSKTVTVTNGTVSWTIKIYDNKDKLELEAWFKDRFGGSENADCAFSDPEIKVGSYTGKLVKAGSTGSKCANGGNYAISTDKSSTVKVDIGKETKENVNKILASFKFAK